MPTTDPAELQLRMLYPELKEEDIAYWRARKAMGDPRPTFSLMAALAGQPRKEPQKKPWPGWTATGGGHQYPGRMEEKPPQINDQTGETIGERTSEQAKKPLQPTEPMDARNLTAMLRGWINFKWLYRIGNKGL